MPSFKLDPGPSELEKPEEFSVGPLDFEGVAVLGKGSFGQVYLVRKMDD